MGSGLRGDTPDARQVHAILGATSHAPSALIIGLRELLHAMHLIHPIVFENLAVAPPKPRPRSKTAGRLARLYKLDLPGSRAGCQRVDAPHLHAHHVASQARGTEGHQSARHTLPPNGRPSCLAGGILRQRQATRCPSPLALTRATLSVCSPPGPEPLPPSVGLLSLHPPRPHTNPPQL